jgi:hypothetical protein
MRRLNPTVCIPRSILLDGRAHEARELEQRHAGRDPAATSS